MGGKRLDTFEEKIKREKLQIEKKQTITHEKANTPSFFF